MNDDEDKAYSWETEYERTWEGIREDEHGLVAASVEDIIHKAKRRRLENLPTNIRLGMMRHTFVVIDMSKSMGEQDLKPTRFKCCLKLLQKFIDEYFDQNPISQIGFIIMRNKRAERICELSGNSRQHLSILDKLKDKPTSGEPSLQNALEMALSTLKNMPGHTSREILLLMGSLTTCDPGDIQETINSLKAQSVRCSVIGLAAEVRICKWLCEETKGVYDVILDESHLSDLLLARIRPPPATQQVESSLIRMGFPQHSLHPPSNNSMNGDNRNGEISCVPTVSVCACHADSTSYQGPTTLGYFCPQCRSKYCELPVECKVCSLTLVSAPHLARSYHHLFPLEGFKEVPVQAPSVTTSSTSTSQKLPSSTVLNHSSNGTPTKTLSSSASEAPTNCFSCQCSLLAEKAAYRCTKCAASFCTDCDLFIHESLHTCPKCACSRDQMFRSPGGPGKMGHKKVVKL